MSGSPPPRSVTYKHLKFLNDVFRSSSKQTFRHDLELKCSNGSMRYNKLLVGLMFPEIRGSTEYQLSICDTLLLPHHSLEELYDQFTKYFEDPDEVSGDQEPSNNEEEVEDSYEEIVTEFVVQPHEQEKGEQEEEDKEQQQQEDVVQGRRRHSCDECGEVFMHRSSLLRHMKAKHRINPVSSLQSMEIEGKENERSETRTQHSCNICNKTFAFRTHLINHTNTHTKPFRCSLCPDMFAEDTKLASHEWNVHGYLGVNTSGVRAGLFRCKYCTKVFPARSQLVLHERTHTKERPYQCSQCSKKFAAKCNLTAHERIHFGESKRYHCRHPPCDRKFSHTSERKDHETIHTGDKPYMCPVCGERYRRNANLWRHKKRCQGRALEGDMEEVETKMIVDGKEELQDSVMESKYEFVFVDPKSSRGVEVPQVVSEQVVIAS